MDVNNDLIRKVINDYYRVNNKYRRSAQYYTACNRIQDLIRHKKSKIKKPDIINLLRPQRHNVGDIAMASAIDYIARDQDLTIINLFVNKERNYNIKPNIGYIIGGGSILDSRVIGLIDKNIKEHPISLVGIEVFGEPSGATFPKNVVFSSVRSNRSKTKLEKYGCETVEILPDVAWILNKLIPINPIRKIKTKQLVLGLNLTSWPKPYHWQRISGKETNEEDEITLVQYIKFIDSILRRFSVSGWSIKHIPFALDDYYFAKSVFQGLGHIMNFVPYRCDVPKVIEELSTCDLFIATRYHAHIFGLMRGVPLISIGYSMQVRQLQSLLRMTRDQHYPHAVPNEITYKEDAFVLNEKSRHIKTQEAICEVINSIHALRNMCTLSQRPKQTYF